MLRIDMNLFDKSMFLIRVHRIYCIKETNIINLNGVHYVSLHFCIGCCVEKNLTETAHLEDDAGIKLNFLTLKITYPINVQSFGKVVLYDSKFLNLADIYGTYFVDVAHVKIVEFELGLNDKSDTASIYDSTETELACNVVSDATTDTSDDESTDTSDHELDSGINIDED